MKIQIINGPNLNLLGEREKSIYGEISFEKYLEILKKHFSSFTIDYFQSNVEGELINCIHDVRKSHKGIILNGGGYTHTSVSLRDAISSLEIPTVEVHVSNVFSREEFRHTSLIAPVCLGSVIGFGLDGYRLAIESLRFYYSKK
jgi:3-dehydroquinate dehydratase-2